MHIYTYKHTIALCDTSSTEITHVTFKAIQMNSLKKKLKSKLKMKTLICACLAYRAAGVPEKMSESHR